MGYISSSLAKVDLIPKSVRCTSFRPFWNYNLTLVKRERGRLWKAAISCPTESAEVLFLESKARRVKPRLRSEVCFRERQGFVALVDYMASKPVAEVMRYMSSIKRRRPG